MGKAKKVKVSKQGEQLSLDKQIEAHRYAKPSSRTKERQRKDEEEDYVASGLSERILKQARQQNLELEEEEGIAHPRSLKTLKLSEDLDSDDDKDASDEEDLDKAYYDDINVDEEDEKALALFMNPSGKTGRTLADIIMEKITEKQTELRTELSDAGTLQLEDVDPRVKQMYEGVRDVLAKYRSGKLPKAFKIIPKLKNWEQILYITDITSDFVTYPLDPPKWSAASLYQATRVFASNLKDNMAQRFYNLVLLPRVRDDIAEYKRLNFHIYQALRKALFKPGAFMKGVLLPLCESGTCTLREAVIVGSVVAQNSIPMLHSAAAILKVAEMDYNGANSIFLRILLDKKYALPYRVVDATLFHFLRFERDERELPVLWHQALLTFVQRYKGDISTEQRTAIFALIRKKSHHSITPEIRRELFSAKCRDEEVGQEGGAAMED